MNARCKICLYNSDTATMLYNADSFLACNSSSRNNVKPKPSPLFG